MVACTQDAINEVIELILGQRIAGADDLLIDGYGAESIDIANIATALERRYGISISETSLSALRTPRDFFEIVRASSL